MIIKNMFTVLLMLIAHSLYSTNVADTNIIRQHLKSITKTEKARNYENLNELNSVAQYIYDLFSDYADTTFYQPFLVDGREYKNVIGVFGRQYDETIVVGAHYDVCGDQEGADDNASGVVGLLELARMLKSQQLTRRIEFVAYSLEEPPFFRSEDMGSFVHAKSLHDREVNVLGMVCLEMIGYFSSEKNSQDYPIGMFSWFYGKTGNYIALVSKFGKGKFASKFQKQFLEKNTILTKTISAPQSLQGIDFSDHLNYWHFGYSAIMITDTAFYRNKNYHKPSDTMETLDIPKMAKVIDGVFLTLLDM